MVNISNLSKGIETAPILKLPTQARVHFGGSENA